MSVMFFEDFDAGVSRRGMVTSHLAVEYETPILIALEEYVVMCKRQYEKDGYRMSV